MFLDKLFKKNKTMTKSVAEKNSTKRAPTIKEADGFYKGYDMRWLKDLGEEHPDFYLVAEYEAKQKKEVK